MDLHHDRHRSRLSRRALLKVGGTAVAAAAAAGPYVAGGGSVQR